MLARFLYSVLTASPTPGGIMAFSPTQVAILMGLLFGVITLVFVAIQFLLEKRKSK